ncbi:MAG: hypothetical protein D9V47_13820 [Clostridia bacterium]|nr:MAG: hypothetical protein D9V47_13820 [Clostridia bacterium]
MYAKLTVFGKRPSPIMRSEYEKLNRAGWVEWVPSERDYGEEDYIVLTPPGTSGYQELVSRDCRRPMELG